MSFFHSCYFFPSQVLPWNSNSCAFSFSCSCHHPFFSHLWFYSYDFIYTLLLTFLTIETFPHCIFLNYNFSSVFTLLSLSFFSSNCYTCSYFFSSVLSFSVADIFFLALFLSSSDLTFFLSLIQGFLTNKNTHTDILLLYIKINFLFDIWK